MRGIQVTWNDRLLDSAVLNNAHCAGERQIFTFNTIAEMRANPTTLCLKFAIVYGATSAGDGYGGEYRWDKSSTDDDDGVSTVKPSDNEGPGRWKKFL